MTSPRKCAAVIPSIIGPTRRGKASPALRPKKHKRAIRPATLDDSDAVRARRSRINRQELQYVRPYLSTPQKCHAVGQWTPRMGAGTCAGRAPQGGPADGLGWIRRYASASAIDLPKPGRGARLCGEKGHSRDLYPNAAQNAEAAGLCG